MSYQERETALFGESSSGSDYDTEEALSQPTTDDGSVDHVEEATVPSRPVPGAIVISPLRPFVTAVLNALLRGIRGTSPL